LATGAFWTESAPSLVAAAVFAPAFDARFGLGVPLLSVTLEV
jgi:hypothetical protein